jgi:hypothetical protein
MHFGIDNAPEDAEFGRVGHITRELCDRDVVGETNCATIRTGTEVNNCVDCA